MAVRTERARTAASNGRKTSPGPVTVGKGELLPAAARLFGTVGYGNATTRELARQLGVRSASLYYHIGKKEDLLYSICVDALERIRTVVAAAVEAEPDPLERVKVLIRTHLVVALTDVDEHRTMLIELKHLTARRRAKVVELRDAYEDVVRRTIAGGQSAGAIRGDIRAKHLTLAVLNLLNWSIFWYQPGGGLTPERLGDLLADLFVEGARDRGTSTRERAG